MNPDITAFFDPATYTVSYIVADPTTHAAAIVDSVLDFDPNSGRTSKASADRLIEAVRARGLTIEWILETHVHADHLSAAPYLKETLGGRIGIGEHVRQVQKVFGKLFNAEPGFAPDGRQFDHLFTDGERFRIGALEAEVLHTPGHTPADLTYVIGDAAFIGDTLFMPDYGSARCDFPGGDAAALYQSIQKILALDPATRLHLCHDYPPAERAPTWVSSVAAQRRENVHVREGVSQSDFVSMRTARDKTLAMPVLILPSVQVNMRAGKLPLPEGNGVSYLKVPLNLL